LKKQACAEAGVAYSTFMLCQARNKSLRARIEEATRISRKKRRRDVLFKGLLSEQSAMFNLGLHHSKQKCRTG
jgi:hypothetical protein